MHAPDRERLENDMSPTDVLHGIEGICDAWIKGMRKHGHKSPPVNSLRAFLLVMQEEGLSVEEYSNRLKVSKSTMSRQLLDLGDRNRKGEPGVGLVTSRPNPIDRRQVEYRLTSKGRAVAAKIEQAMQMTG
jgi:hypothetical protein